ncbi:MAG: class I SAM-dependent methyltransferase [Planctomycetota bacterium]
MTDDVRERMRREWEARARENARYYIADRESQGIAFALSGCRDAYRILEELHPYLAEDQALLEIGCGTGRMLRFFAVIFREAHGVDVAPGMVEQGRAELAGFDNVALHLGDGRSLAGIADGSIDVAVSHAVFQHVPDLGVIRDYVAEAHRVLRPGGVFKFLVKTERWPEQGAEHDTWHGVEVGREDVDRWVAEMGWTFLNGYTADEPSTAWVVLRKP